MAAISSSCGRAQQLLSVLALLAIACNVTAAPSSAHDSPSDAAVGKKSAVLSLRDLKWVTAASKIQDRSMQAQIIGEYLVTLTHYLPNLYGA